MAKPGRVSSSAGVHTPRRCYSLSQEVRFGLKGGQDWTNGFSWGVCFARWLVDHLITLAI